jgi:hypothetical protein
MTLTRRLVPLLMIALVVATVALAGGPKIRTTYSKDFNFLRANTYAWHPTGAGEVKLLVVGAGNAEDYRRRLEPTIVQAVDALLAERGLKKVPSGEAALYVNYYALLGQGTSAQEMGQFVPPMPEWGLPPLAPSTTPLMTYPMGSLILDISSRTLGSVVWRSVAEAEIDRMQSDPERQKRLTNAVRDMLKKFPPKK